MDSSQLQNSQINIVNKILIETKDLTKSQQVLIKSTLNTNGNDDNDGEQKLQPNNQNQTSQRFQQNNFDWTFSNIWAKYKSIVIAVIFGTLMVISGIVVLIVMLTKNSSESNNNLNPISHTNQQVYDLIKLNSTSALCLDGSTAGYFLSRTGDPSKIFLYFQYGGWCGHLDYQKTLDSCYQRSNTKYGSMGTATTGTATYSQGILSNNEKNYFKDWKKVYLRYCDGSGHQGTRNDPILHNGKLLYFRGHNITVERLQSLQEKIGLFSNSTQIVVSGESAGGLASMMWSNYIADRAIKATVRSIPGEGIFYDSYHLQYNDYFVRQSFKNIVNITNQEIDMPVPQCVSNYTTNKQKCFFVQYLHQFIRVPTFMIQPLYDSYSIPNVIGVTCNDMSTDTFKNCDSSQRTLIENYRNNLTNVLIEIGNKPGNGVWGISCPVHILMSGTKLYDEFYRVPQYSLNSANQAIKNWMQNKPINHTSIDTAQWPNNHPCQAYAS